MNSSSYVHHINTLIALFLQMKNYTFFFFCFLRNNFDFKTIFQYASRSGGGRGSAIMATLSLSLFPGKCLLVVLSCVSRRTYASTSHVNAHNPRFGVLFRFDEPVGRRLERVDNADVENPQHTVRSQVRVHHVHETLGVAYALFACRFRRRLGKLTVGSERRVRRHRVETVTAVARRGISRRRPTAICQRDVTQCERHARPTITHYTVLNISYNFFFFSSIHGYKFRKVFSGNR